MLLARRTENTGIQQCVSFGKMFRSLVPDLSIYTALSKSKSSSRCSGASPYDADVSDYSELLWEARKKCHGGLDAVKTICSFCLQVRMRRDGF